MSNIYMCIYIYIYIGSQGLTRTDMIADVLKTKPDLSMIPMNRPGEPLEIAEAMVRSHLRVRILAAQLGLYP